MTIDWSDLNTRGVSLSTEVATYLERLIHAGELSPGDRLPPERDIAQRLGLSRASVRDAMHELSLKGLTERRPGRGTVVTDKGEHVSPLLGALERSQRRLIEVADLRQVCEPSVAELAAARATQGDLRRLDDTLRRSSPELGVTGAVQLDEEFHSQLAQATQNPMLVALVDVMHGWLRDFRRRSHSSRAGRAASIDGHLMIYRAISTGDQQAAYVAMRDHVADIARLIDENEEVSADE